MKRKLIVNADDFGYTSGINAAIDRCANGGLLRSATIMASGSAFEDAVGIAKRNANLRIGVHLVLTELKAVASVSEIHGLVDQQGFLPPTPGALWNGILRGKINSQAIFLELNEQVSKVLDHGIPVSHLDSHKHVHILPEVAEVVCEIACHYSIPWIRSPFDRTPGWLLFAGVGQKDRGVFCKQHLSARLMAGFRPFFLRRIRRFGIGTADYFFGVSLTGIWTEMSAASLIKRLPPGLTEWMVHPGDCDSELRKRQTRLVEQRENERDMLVSPVLKKYIAENDIELKYYGE